MLLDGHDLRDLAPGVLAEHAALVPQHAFLFDDTVRGNVSLGADVPDEEVWAALRTAQADGFVAALPDGLDARLGERGTSLSGGQRQRLSLARALVRRPRLLVMDDATSAVDPEVEARILAALRGAPGDGGTHDSSVLVVAYRKATIALADEVVYLKDGQVDDQGTHADLLVRNPGYADLVNAYEQETEPGEVSVPMSDPRPSTVRTMDTGGVRSPRGPRSGAASRSPRSSRTASAGRWPTRLARDGRAASSCPSRCSRPSTGA